jgi:hypothetical protein
MATGDKEVFDYNYIEPNLSLINEQISNINMITKMFDLLKISEELRSTKIGLEEMKSNLSRVKGIMIKELNSEKLTEEDLQFISLLALEFKSESNVNKVLRINSNSGRALNYDISKSKLLITVNQINGIKTFAVSPVFSYREY